MKNEKLFMSRESWESFREYRKAPFKRKYEELGEFELDLDFLDEYENVLSI